MSDVCGVLLRFVLWIVACVHPIVMGTRMCHVAYEKKPLDVRLVTNLALSMIIIWAMEMLDVFLVSYLLPMGNFYTCLRIIISLYISHPRFCGAVRAYNYFLASPLRCYAPQLEDILRRHIAEVNRTGVSRCVSGAGKRLLAACAAVVNGAMQLAVVSADTDVKPANLERRLVLPMSEGEVMAKTSSSFISYFPGMFSVYKSEALEKPRSPRPTFLARRSLNSSASCETVAEYYFLDD